MKIDKLRKGRVVALAGLSLIGLITAPQSTRGAESEQIQLTAPMAVARLDHVATVLADGRVLITGGRDASGALASAEIFDPTTRSFVFIGNMSAARFGHAATLLPNGKVLITGGQDSSGPLASVEIFDSQAPVPFHALAASMVSPRVHHTATLLGTGKVLVAGGDAAGTAELFDPESEIFSSETLQLAEPRTGHTATLFSENNVFLAGGGTKSAEFFDGLSNSFSLWPLELSEVRFGHAAIPTMDAKLLIIGGDATGSFESFDPSTGSVPLAVALGTPSSTATLLANNRILVLGAETSSLFDQPTASLTSLAEAASLQRSGHTATELSADKRVLVAGGVNSSNELVSVAALYNPAHVATDQDDYPPFSYVDVTGSGFLPSEMVSNQIVQLQGPAPGTAYDAWGAVADTNGAINTSWLVFSEDLLNTTLELTSIGQTSGLKAQAIFTDASSADMQLTSLTDAPDPVTANANITYTITATNNGPNQATTAKVTNAIPAGATFVSETHSSGWTASTPAVGGTGNVIWSMSGNLNKNSGGLFTLVVKVNCATPNGTVITDVASTGSNDTDPTLGNNSATTTTTVSHPVPSFGASCPSDITVNTGPGNANCSQTASWTAPAATTICGSVTLTSNHNPGDTFPVGQTTVTYTATDPAGAQTQCSFKVTVHDTTPPTITCPANKTVNTAAGLCTAVVSGIDPTFSDNCSGSTVAYALSGATTGSGSGSSSGKTFNKGLTTVAYTVTDASANTANCSFTVTVNDTEKPVITCPTNITVNAAPGSCASNVTFVVTATDNCAVSSLVSSPPSGSAFPVGTTTVTNTATDSSGNTSQCTFAVTVVDNQPPTINCPSDLTDVPTDPGQCYASKANVNLGTPVTSDNCAVATATNNGPTQFPKGDTIVTWTVTDTHGNTATCNQKVTVKDHENPTITCPGNITINTDAGLCSAIVSYSVASADNCPGQTVSQTGGLVSGSAFPKGITTNSFKVTDASGNTASCSFTVTVNDNEAPTIACPASITVNTDPGLCSAVVSYVVTSADNCPGQTVSQTGGLMSGSAFPKGITTNSFKVTDASGNTASCSFTVRVNDNEAPTIACPANITINTDPGLCSAVVSYSVTSADNCPGQTVAQTAGLASGSAFPKGITTNSFTVTDASSNTASCSFTVTVNDNEVPTISCPANITVNTDPGLCSAAVSYSVTSADNCPGQTVAQTGGLPSGSAFPKGITTNSFTVTDASGSTASCSFTVTVNDNEIPTIACPANIVVNTDPGLCSAVVSYSVTSADNCPGQTVAQTAGLASGSAFPKGITTNSFKVTDANGNTASCSFTVTVNDNEAPTISCPANIVVNTDPGLCSTVVSYSVTSADNCPGQTVAQTAGLPSGSAFPKGITTNSFTVTDASGNIASCSFTVTVNDNEMPTISCPGNIVVNTDPGFCSAVVSYAVTSADNCPGQTVAQTAGLPSSSAFPKGVTTNSFMVTDASGNTASCSFIVTVKDNEMPTISCPGNIVVNTDPGFCSAVVSYAVTSADNCPGQTVAQTAGLPSSSAFPKGVTTNSFMVTDASGNTASCSFIVTVKDNEMPTISCPGNIVVNTDPGLCSAVVSYAVTSADNCPGQAVAQTAGLPSSSAFPKGITTNSFTVTDASGNTASCSFTVTVNDNEAPTIACPANITINTDPGLCSAVVSYAVTSADNCPGQTVAQTAGLASGSAFPKGITTNGFTVTDASGNTASCSFTVTVNDNEAPTISCPANITVNTDPGLCSAVVSYVVTSADNCPGQIVSQTAGLPSGSAFPKGITTNSFTVTDASGNTASCSFIVAVNDNEAPTITSPKEIEVKTDPGLCSAVVTYTVTSNDNCPGQTVAQMAGLPSGSAFPKGVTLNSFTVTDASGNTATCSFTVTVNDTEPPTISCPGDMVVNTDPGLCSAVVSYVVTSTDNCPGQTVTQTAGLPSGSAFPKGTTENSFIVIDASGNTASCSFTITVNDNEMPTISCPGDMVVNTDPGLCSSVVAYSVTSADNCPGTTIKQTAGLASGSAFPKGVTTNSFIATDASGNSATCSFTVTVEDHELPVISGPANMVVNTDPGQPSAVVSYSLTSMDNCSGPTVTKLAGLLSGAAFPVGTTTNTFKTIDASGNTASYSFTVTVADNEPPTITCPANIVLNTDPGLCSAVVNYSVSSADNCPGQTVAQICGLPSGSAFPKGVTTNKFKVTDASGNTASGSFTVTVNDNEMPTISCPANIVVNTDPGLCSAVVSYSVSSADNCPGQTVAQICGLPSGSAFPKGVTTNKFKVTDASGNTASSSFTVTVKDVTPPAMQCPPDKQLQCGDSTAPSNTGAATATDNCDGTATITFRDVPTAANCTGKAGIDRTWKAMDASGNTSTSVQHIVFVDTTAPVITCPTGVTVQCAGQVPAPATNTAGFVAQGGTVSDGCGTAITVTFLSDTITNQTCANRYSVLRKYLATDACGNTATGTQTITVNDTTPPSITCPSNISVTSLASVPAPATNVAGLTAQGGSASDNCGVPAISSADVTNGTVITRTYTARDACGLTTTCAQIITVQAACGSCPAVHEAIQTEIEHSRIYFDNKGNSQFAFFHGGVTFTGGDLAPDFRILTNKTAKGSLRVTICGNVVYCKDNIPFSVNDCNNSADDREKWDYNVSPTEKVTFRWKETQQFDATNDPNVPKSPATGNKNVGKLSSEFIHVAETRYSYNFKDATLPIEIRLNGIKLLSVNANNQVSTPFPYWKNGKMVEVLFPDRLQPGDVLVYDNDSNSTNGVIYTQSVSADGNCTDEFFNAGGKFFFKVPVTGLSTNCLPRQAKVEFSVGQAGASLVGCGTDSITLYQQVGHCHKFSLRGDDEDEDACENEVEDDD